MTPSKIVLYGRDICPHTHRTSIALELAGVDYEMKLVDVTNKPDWFIKLSPTAKVPTLDVDGQIFVESLVTTGLVAGLFPQAQLVSKDAFVNARSALWADRFAEYFGSLVTLPFRDPDASAEEVHDKFFEGLDKALPYLGTPGPFAAGQIHPLLGDVIVAPYVGRIEKQLELGYLPQQVRTTLTTNEKYAPYVRYTEAITSLPAYKKTFYAEELTDLYSKRTAPKYKK